MVKVIFSPVSGQLPPRKIIFYFTFTYVQFSWMYLFLFTGKNFYRLEIFYLSNTRSIKTDWKSVIKALIKPLIKQ